MDVTQAMIAVEEFHKVNLTLEMRLPRPGRKGLLEVKLTAQRWEGGFLGAKPSVSRSVHLTGGDPLTVAATTFRLVYDVDKDCGAMWSQEELFKRA